MEIPGHHWWIKSLAIVINPSLWSLSSIGGGDGVVLNVSTLSLW